MKNWFNGLSTVGKAFVVSLSAVLGIGVLGAFAQESDTTQQSSTSSTKSIQQEPETTKKTVIETESIAYETSTSNDSNLDAGVTKTITEGAAGERQITYEVTYRGDEEISKTEVSRVVTKEPTTKVVHVGTKTATQESSCPNGTYVNSSGNKVCRPYESESNSAPADATARCADGTYSSSQSRRGTCSHHGGVSEWL